MEEAMDSSSSSTAGKKALQGVGEVQTAIKSLEEQVDASKSVSLLLDIKAKQEALQELSATELAEVFARVLTVKDPVGVGPLHVAAHVGNESMCQWLLEQGKLAVHSLDKFGQTPLHYAAAQGHVDTIKRLRFHHGDVFFRSKNGSSVLDVVEGEEAKEALIGSRFSGEEVEDEYLQEKLPVLVDHLLQAGKNQEMQTVLQLGYCLRGEIRSATSSLTSVPKPLKILCGRFDDLKGLFEELKLKDATFPSLPQGTTLANILSILAMARKDGDPERDCMRYCISSRRALLGMGKEERATQDPVTSFGDPYIRHLCMQFAEEYQDLDPTDTASRQDHGLLVELRDELVCYLLQHNAEPEVCDLLIEMEDARDIKDELRRVPGAEESLSECLLRLLRQAVPERAAQVKVNDRTCQYLISCVKYVQEPMNSRLLETALDLYMVFEAYPQALLVAMQLNKADLIRKVFVTCQDDLVRKQLAFMLGRQQVFLDLEDEEGLASREDLKEIISNVLLNNNFLNLARELDIVEPKDPDHIYKTHLENARFSSVSNVDSAKQNLASSFVNGLVNCAFGKDNTMTKDGNKWIYKHKATGMMSATASLGLILLWDVDAGLTEIDKFLYATEDNIKAGALLGCGIVNSGVRNECDPALALLSDFVLHKSPSIRTGAILGLGLAYAGSNREEVLDSIIPAFSDPDSTPEVVGLAALSCGLVSIGSCHESLTDTLLQLMMDKEGEGLSNSYMRFVALGLALLYLGKQECGEVPLAALETVGDPLGKVARVLMEICSYAGTGDVLRVQALLHTCSEHFADKEAKSQEESSATSAGGEDKDKKEQPPKPEPGSLAEVGSHQAFAVLGLALIAMGEGIGSEMALRTFNHLLQYGEPVIRRSVPLALCLVSVSHPELSIMDTLSKFSHDSDPEVAYSAILAMGIIGAGTNNARLGGLLRQLAQFYCKDPSALYMVRLAQGLTHLGKGTLTLNPFHSHQQLMSPVAVGGLLAVLTSALDCKNLLLTSSPHLLYCLVPAIQPRMLVAFNEKLEPLTVNVRVGQAVDTVAQAGHQKSITGFQTHTTPVLLAHGERAELASDEYIPLSPILEGFVILRKNKDYEEQ